MYTYTRRAQYHETDQMGIIHHSNYVKWMEETRIRFLEEMGVDYPEAGGERDHLSRCRDIRSV